MDERKIIKQRTKFGEWYERDINLNAKVETLNFIQSRLLNNNCNSSQSFTLGEYLDKKLPYYRQNKKEIQKHKQRVIRLQKTGWLKQTNKENKIEPSSKFKHYLEKWGNFNNPESPLIKKRQSRVIERVIERETPVEIKTKTMVKDKFIRELNG